MIAKNELNECNNINYIHFIILLYMNCKIYIENEFIND